LQHLTLRCDRLHGEIQTVAAPSSSRLTDPDKAIKPTRRWKFSNESVSRRQRWLSSLPADQLAALYLQWTNILSKLPY